MKVKELIEKLETLDPELHVFVYGYEGGYDFVHLDPEEKSVALDVHKEWYYGKHDDAEEHHESVVKGVVLGGA